MPWQTLGLDDALEHNDAGAESGNAILVPGERFGVTAVGDMRLKALRDAQQLIEYLTLLGERHRLTRNEIKAMLHNILHSSELRPSESPAASEADFTTLTAWQFAGLRRRVAELLAKIARRPRSDGFCSQPQPDAQVKESHAGLRSPPE